MPKPGRRSNAPPKIFPYFSNLRPSGASAPAAAMPNATSHSEVKIKREAEEDIGLEDDDELTDEFPELKEPAVDSDEEDAFVEAERATDPYGAMGVLDEMDGNMRGTPRIKKEEGAEKRLAGAGKRRGNNAASSTRRGEIKKESGKETLVKAKDEAGEEVKKEELDELDRLPAPPEDPRFDEEAIRLRDAKRSSDRAKFGVLAPEDPEQRLAQAIARLEQLIGEEQWATGRRKMTLLNEEVRQWYLSSLFYRIINEGFRLSSDPIDLKEWETLGNDIKNLRRPLEKLELEALFRQFDALSGRDIKTREGIHWAKYSLFEVSQACRSNWRFVESPSTDVEWDAFDTFRRTCLNESEVLYFWIECIQRAQKFAVHGQSKDILNAADDAEREVALQLHKELKRSPRFTGKKRAASTGSRLPSAPTSPTSAASTMSTPPQEPIDLTSPITSPIPKRLKISHDSSDKMTPATTSEPKNIPVPVTKVQDGPHLLIKKLSDKAKLPTRGSAFAAGYDIYASKETKIPARGKGLVDTDLSMAVPAGTYGRIAPRSGLANKNFIDTGAGVIDADYRGQVKVLLFNHSDVDFVIKEHDRIAQLILERIYTPEVMEVEELEESVRGEGGFGSTGVSIV